MNCRNYRLGKVTRSTRWTRRGDAGQGTYWENYRIGYRIDLLVEDNIIVELKSAERIAPVHKAQLLTYLKLAGLQVGLLLNFNVPHLKDAILRVANTLFPSASTAYSAL